MNVRLLIVVNDPVFFLSHRLPVGQAALKAGYEVTVATGPGDGVAAIRAAGMEHRELPLERSGMNPWRELRLLIAIGTLYRRLRPDVIHLVTIKPVLYGGLMARLLRQSGVVSAISGMGYLFSGQSRRLARGVAELLYRVALGHRHGRVIVQNAADRDALRAMGALRSGQAVLIPGSGVDLEEYAFSPLPEGRPVVLLASRMLWNKGVGEFVRAAEILRAQGCDARFVLAGPFDSHNPAAVPLERLEKWQKEGPVEWWGKCDDMPSVLAKASLVVLPSYYREGVPKVLLEAAATGRPIVTTDAPGCRDVVEPSVNGALIPARDAQALADAMDELLSDRNRLSAMGQCGRQKAEAEFDVRRVVETHMAIYRSVLEEIRA